MAKPVTLLFQGSEVLFAPARVERSRLYGSRKRVAVDAAGQVCTRAALTQDGTTLLTSGMTAQGHFTPDGRWISRAEMVGLDATGQIVAVQPSTLGVPQPVAGPVDPAEVLSLSLQSVYLLTPSDPTHPLITALRDGQVFRCPFNYAAGLEVETAYLLGNDEGCFALVGQRAPAPWTEEGATFVAETLADDDSADLDFDQL